MRERLEERLKRYLDLIGCERGRTLAPDLATLRAVHRHHVTRISYENIDVVLERPVDRSVDRIIAKLVDAGRGGWCYEMNGLLGWALAELGFQVEERAGAVMRAKSGDQAIGNHLVLLVTLGQTRYVVDVGLGDGPIEPYELRPGAFEQFGQSYRLELLGLDEWRLHNRSGAMPPSFDFFSAVPDDAALNRTCETLQTDPESMFRQNLICMRPQTDGNGQSLVGRVLTQQRSGERTLLQSADELRATLTGTFDLRIDGLGDGGLEELWSRVAARHQALFGDTPLEEIDFSS
ncbi:MAG: arylamine N-acetyltransferase [Pseudomonadota bacterium]